MPGKVVWSRRSERDMDGQFYTELATVHAGRKAPSMGGVWLREHFNYPGGSGFGVEHLPKEERRWPVVTLHVSLPVGQMDLRDELTSMLKAVTEDFLEKHHLLDEQE